MAKTKQVETVYSRFFRGETQAIAEIAQTYRLGLTLFINGYVRDMETAEDLASETFATLLIKRPKIKNQSSFKTYLYSMGKNAALGWLRKNKKRVDLESVLVVNTTNNPEITLIEEEQRKMIYSALLQIKEEYRSVLFLRYYEDLKIEEIVFIIKKNKKQVYNLLQRAKSALKEILEKEGVVNEID